MNRRPRIAVLVLTTAIFAAGFLWLIPGAGSAAVIPSCGPTVAEAPNVLYTAGTTLTHGTYRELRCTTEAGKTYDLVLDYSSAGDMPYDIGNYVGLQLYRDEGFGVRYLGKSMPSGVGQETLRWTSNGDETWYIKVENLAQDGNYDAEMGLNVVVPGGGEGG